MLAVTSPLPDLVLYTRPGCHLCHEARAAIDLLLADRASRGLAVPRVVERDIDADPDLQRRWFDRIPVVELGEGRLELAIGIGALRRLLAEALDQPHPAEASR
jgi:Glutaredoxin-like domain (DUF836)